MQVIFFKRMTNDVNCHLLLIILGEIMRGIRESVSCLADSATQ